MEDGMSQLMILKSAMDVLGTDWRHDDWLFRFFKKLIK